MRQPRLVAIADSGRPVGQASVPHVPVALAAPCSLSLVGSSDHAPATAKTSSSLTAASAPVTDKELSIGVGWPDCWCSPDSLT